jgi:hypothetical protein
MKAAQNLLGAVHSVLWIATLAGIDLTFSESPSRAAYGILCCWCVTQDVSLLLRTTWRPLPVFLGLMTLALVVDVAKGTGFLYHDAPTIGTATFPVLLAALLLVWASPIRINQITTSLRDWIVNADNAR